ncbi:MAG TPA: hypothetical protein DCX25_01620 [Candidatus Pacebacteria bacterium]|nr:MAG: hypothetical protein UX00_C0009G0043 [Microgenomates group bacterium GW2011_GWB1_45_17]KKU23293.1 MAG: hypothetical protein UX35_C0007G0031 [Microgenomates group bacterium GW2011_GWA1_46_15]KKU23462.1 MAG: hypothetical protein UX36_C0005G0043 [Microgenomates group bacterium GW2011_GWC1_46_15]HAV15004.1 hypothetical protein [Candidatus Paceibacterota bacterium]HCR11150.1 hypothetical protein [Candidatus Paceibacterota bacterium]
MAETFSPTAGYERHFIIGNFVGAPYYTYPFGERVTPEKDIPQKYRVRRPLPGGKTQVCDSRIAYTFHPKVGAYLECADVAFDEEW